MSSRVVSKFCHREECGPFLRFVQGEQPKVSFQLLIYSFGFPISLGVIGSGKGDVVLKEMGKFLCEGRGELWSLVGDYLRVKAELRENMSEKELGNSGSVNVFCAGAINYPLCKPMVNHDHNQIITVRIG